MSVKENVIHLPIKRKTKAGSESSRAQGLKHKAPVVDMSERREEIIQDERRRVKRTILSEFIGVHVVVPGHGLMKVTLHDVSEDGLSFDTQIESGRFRANEEIAMRVYLNRKTYFPFNVVIGNVRDIEGEAVIRHGAKFVKGSLNEEALHHFIAFIETVSASLQNDTGDVVISRRLGGGK